MGKVSELSMLVDELKKCGETLISISEELTGLFSSAEPEKQPIKKGSFANVGVGENNAVSGRIKCVQHSEKFS